jgi:hypothetical protein
MTSQRSRGFIAFGRFLMLALPLALLFGFCTLTPRSAHAQGLRISQPPPDCSLAAKRYDNPFSDSHGWTMRRYEWHAFYFGLSTIAAEGIHRVTKLPRWASATIATVGIGVIPHIRGGIIKRQYPIAPLDWAFDGVNRAAPLIIWTGASGKTWQSRTLAATTIASSYFALACYASP